MKVKIVIVLMLISCFYFCRSQKNEISIISTPVFSEKDTFYSSTGNRIINKQDFFLVKGDMTDKSKLRIIVDSFAKIHSQLACKGYNNYLMLFYKESSFLNEQAIKSRAPEYRYKIFNDAWDNDYIGLFDCWNSFQSKTVKFRFEYMQ